MCVMPSDREEKFLVGRTLLDPALLASHESNASESGSEEREIARISFSESEDPDRMITSTCEQVSTTFETLAGPHAENALDLDSTRPPTSHLKDVLSTEQMDKLEQMIEKHKMLFMQSKYDFGRTELIQHRIDLKHDAKPHKEPPRRINWEKREQLEETLQKLQEGGNIKESLCPLGKWSGDGSKERHQ